MAYIQGLGGLQGDVVYISWLTNSALVYRVQMRGDGGIVGSQPMSTAVHITWHGAQINFGDLTPYLTYAIAYIISVIGNCIFVW
jgi:hypothetical protein